MGTMENPLKCPICQDLFVDPVTLPCRHNFCLTCIRAVWNADVSEDGPFFCPECQIIFPSRVPLDVNTDLQTKVKDLACNGAATACHPSVTPGSLATTSPLPIRCDHCIEAAGSVAVRTCLTCDASLCQAHALLHQQRAALREHTVVDVTGDPMSLKCREHREELKLFCMEDHVPVCCLCVLVGLHKNHRAVQLQEACSDFKESAADFRERISDKYSRIRAVLDGDERLMIQIIDAEETYTTEWLETQRVTMETLIKDADSLRAQSRQLLQETNNLTFLQVVFAARQHNKQTGSGETAPSRAMGTMENPLKCPICQDLFVDPVTLPCRHNFCLTCIRAVWNADVSEDGPFFCPECQIIFPSRVPLDVNTDLQTKVKDLACNGAATACHPSVTPGSLATTSPLPIRCDHCIEAAGSVAVRTCLTCDASLCQAHALLHQQRAALREHTVVDVTGDPMSLKCREHREELKLFCMEDHVPVCCLCVLVGLHKNHRAVQLQEACSDFKESAADFRERISDKYSRIRAVLDGDERLMIQIIDAEETYTTEWLETQRVTMETLIKDADSLRAQSRQLLQETNNLTFLQVVFEVDRYLCEPERMRTAERLVDDLSVALSQHFPRILEVSQDRKQVFWCRQPPHETKSTLTPYDCQYSVSAQEGFTAGQHYWEVIVQEKPYWLIGATTGPVYKSNGPRQEESFRADVKGNTVSWCIYHGDGKYLACHDTHEKQLSVQGKRLRKLGMLADLQKGELSFYNADTLTLLEGYPVECTEALYPVLNPCIDVNGVNRQPLSLFCLRDSGDWNVYADENEG
ncbi:unnamed protein product [Merluccius merluccius]